MRLRGPLGVASKIADDGIELRESDLQQRRCGHVGYLRRVAARVQNTTRRALTASVVIIVAGHRKLDIRLPANAGRMDAQINLSSDAGSRRGGYQNQGCECQDEAVSHVRHSMGLSTPAPMT